MTMPFLPSRLSRSIFILVFSALLLPPEGCASLQTADTGDENRPHETGGTGGAAGGAGGVAGAAGTAGTAGTGGAPPPTTDAVTAATPDVASQIVGPDHTGYEVTNCHECHQGRHAALLKYPIYRAAEHHLPYGTVAVAPHQGQGNAFLLNKIDDIRRWFP